MRFAQSLGIALIGLMLVNHSYGSEPDEDFLIQVIDPPLLVQDSTLSDAITVLMQRYDVPIRWMSKELDGIVSGRIEKVSAGDWLSQLGRLYDFYWYFDGVHLEIGDARDVTMGTVTIAKKQADEFMSDVNDSGMNLTALSIDVNPKTGLVFIHGPDSLQNVVKEIAKAYQHAPEIVVRQPPPAVTKRAVRLIYGRYLRGGH